MFKLLDVLETHSLGNSAPVNCDHELEMVLFMKHKDDEHEMAEFIIMIEDRHTHTVW